MAIVNNLKDILLIVGLAGLSSASNSSEVNMPNSFSAGQTASASQVNQNFSAAASAINDNHSRLSVTESEVSSQSGRLDTLESSVTNHANRIDNLETEAQSIQNELSVAATKTSVGVYFDDYRAGSLILAPSGKGNIPGLMLTNTGFLAEISGNHPGVAVQVSSETIWFTEASCVGQPYAISNTYFTDYAFYGTDFVIRNASEYFYIPMDTAWVGDVQLASYKDGDGTCFFTSSNTTVRPIFPNDLSVTGIDSTELSGTFRLGVD